jgi:group I intron endonuclease
MGKFSRIIYAVVNTITGSKYIGATTKNLEKRKRDHLQKARKKVGGDFQNALRTYGTEAFQWVQIDTANSSNELADKERDYILKYNTDDNGYNRDRGGGFQKNIYQYDQQTGSLISSYSRLESAAFSVGVDKKTISKACLGEIKNCAGYYWSYTLSDNFMPEADKRKKKVFQFYPHGEFIQSYKSVAEAAKTTGISSSSIAKCCRGEYKVAGGLNWEYED